MNILNLFRKKKKIKAQESLSKNYNLHYKLGLALSGGGARGFAHIGAIKAFEEMGLVFDYVAGTSAGSFVGAAYAAGFSAQNMTEFTHTFADSDIKSSHFLLSASPSSNIERVADRLLNGITFDELKIPFRAVSVDLITGEEYVFNKGHVAKAVSASCAVPFVFKPVKYEDKVLVDGGLLNTIPADIVRSMGADFVISVDINSTRGMGLGDQKDKFLNVATATWRIIMKSTAFRGQMNTDIMIKPDLTQFKSTSSLGRADMIEIGYQATMAAKSEIFSALGIKTTEKATEKNTEKATETEGKNGGQKEN